MMVLLDASLIIAVYNKEDVHYNNALLVWRDIENGKYGEYVSTDFIFNEVVGVFNRKYGKKRAMEIGNFIINTIPLFSIDAVFLAKSWDFFNETKLQLNPVDCSTAIIVDTLDCEFLATFDKEFKKLDFVEVVGC